MEDNFQVNLLQYSGTSLDKGTLQRGCCERVASVQSWLNTNPHLLRRVYIPESAVTRLSSLPTRSTLIGQKLLADGRLSPRFHGIALFSMERRGTKAALVKSDEFSSRHSLHFPRKTRRDIPQSTERKRGSFAKFRL